MQYLRFLISAVSAAVIGAVPSFAASTTHSAPVVIPASKLKELQFAPLQTIFLFASDAQGIASIIPFQIDEKDKYSDFILDQGRLPNQSASNKVFDHDDELSFMGEDMGPVLPPKKWPGTKPSRVVEIKESLGTRSGAVYAAIFERDPPALSPRHYVSFNLAKAEVVTGKYSYRFNHDNYLVVRDVAINERTTPYPLLDSSTFYLRADFKFFVSISVNQSAIKSSLEAYKTGPIRAITRVNFDYNILTLKLDLGMYTEVSFFANSVLLPAIVENPLNSKKILNRGSLFYYGFSLVENPGTLGVNANMPPYQQGDDPFGKITDAFVKADGRYWVSAGQQHFMFFLEMITSPEMREDKNIPTFFTENASGKDIASRPSNAAPLGRSPVNVALAMSLANLREGVHKMFLRLFIENHYDQATLQSFSTLDQWQLGERLVTN